MELDPEHHVVLDSRTIRGLAHPLRVKMLGLLRQAGPATATQLAVRLGQSSGSTSYHLRQLAAYGFVVEDDSHGEGRERWWKAAHRVTHFDAASTDPEIAAAGEMYMRAIVRTYSEKMEAALDAAATAPQAWREASDMSDTMLWLTPDEAKSLHADLEAVLARYELRDGPDGEARQVAIQTQIFPVGLPELDRPDREEP
jgi:DNA-binding transcriptional ArsR family regulator